MCKATKHKITLETKVDILKSLDVSMSFCELADLHHVSVVSVQHVNEKRQQIWSVSENVDDTKVAHLCKNLEINLPLYIWFELARKRAFL